MQVDFYQLSLQPVEQVVAQLARNTLAAGQRLLVVDADPARRTRLGEALWGTAPFRGQEMFLAHGHAGGEHDARQPILLSEAVDPANGAKFVVLADGMWREVDGFARAFLVFDDATLDGARACWRMLGDRDGIERRYWKQEGAGWVQAA